MAFRVESLEPLIMPAVVGAASAAVALGAANIEKGGMADKSANMQKLIRNAPAIYDYGVAVAAPLGKMMDLPFVKDLSEGTVAAAVAIGARRAVLQIGVNVLGLTKAGVSPRSLSARAIGPGASVEDLSGSRSSATVIR